MDTDSEQDEPGETKVGAARRDALKKIGLFGAYTAPLMVAMLTSKKALAASGGGGCCWTEALLADGGRIGDAKVGDRLLMMEEDGSGAFEGPVQAVRPSTQPCYRVETAAGIRLTCSYSTPMAVRRGAAIVYIDARDCLEGDVVPVLDEGGFRWEPVARLEEVGRLPVQLITANNGVYAAGDEPGRVIFTHNRLKA